MANTAQEAIYSQYYNSVVQLAQKTDAEGRIGVSRPELIHALGISRTIADGLIARCKLRRSRTEGKTEFFSLSRGSKSVVKDTKESSMQDAGAPSPADPKGLVGAIVGDDQPAAKAGGKKGKNRLPAEDQGAPPVPPAPEAPVLATAAVVLTPELGGRKSPEQLNEEITAIKAAMEDATRKSAAAFQTHLTQKARAEALGDKLRAILGERLAV